MKISLNEIKTFTEIDLPVDELVKKIGAQLGEVEAVVDLGEKYSGIVIAKVVSCVKHPNADKLSLCKIDNGKQEIQVVCGAPNVREGLLVAWLPPGATVPATFDKDPLTLEAREIRGEISHGMLASASELGLSDDHSGILELSAGQPGDDFAKTFGLDDYVIDIENKMFTHRPDCFGLLGIAREIAGIRAKSFKSPDWYAAETNPIKNIENDLLAVKNELPDLVPRFMVQVIQNVSVQPSPLWLQIYLSKHGMKSINNIVDMTNYVMHLSGQPLHAYDYDKLASLSNKPTIMSRKPKKGETITVLGGKVIEPHPHAIMIATDKQLIGIGGVIGGADTEVDNTTKNIVLECANFDLYSIRRTSMTHGLFTDAVTRFSKGQSRLQNDRILAYAAKKIIRETNGSANPVYDIQTKTPEPAAVNVSMDFINSRLGLELDAAEAAALLINVEFIAEDTRGDVLIVKPPFWRTDIEIAEDIVEEIGRLYGYDHLPQNLPKRSLTPVGPDNLLELKAELRQQLAKSGANEVLTYSFIHGKLMEKTGQDRNQAYKIANALSPDLQYYRLSLTPNLLEKVHPIIKTNYGKFAIFEIGKVHGQSELDNDDLPKELERVALVFASKNPTQGAAYYQALALMADIVYSRFGGVNMQPLKGSKFLSHKMFAQMIAPYDPDRSAVIQNFESPLGVIGEFKPSVSSRLKLPVHTAGFELFLNPLLEPKLPAYSALSKYPSLEQDITLKTGMSLAFRKIIDELHSSLRKNAPEDVEITTSCIDIFSKDNTNKHTTFRIAARSQQRTLTSEIINNLLDKTAEELKGTLKAERL